MSNPLPEIAAPEHPRVLLPPPDGTPLAEPPRGAPPEKRRRRRRLWLYALILIALGFAVWWWLRRPNGNGNGAQQAASHGRGAPAVTPVVAVLAKKGDIGVYVTGLGAVTPLVTDTVRSRVDGELMDVHFKEGELVHKGDPLIEIDPRPYQAVVTQANGALVRDQALLANAKVDLARYTTLLAENAIPEQQLATQKALVAQYEGIIENDRGLLQAANLNVAYCHITAPITGIVGLRLVDPGNIVHASDANGMLVITQIQPISVIFTVAEDQLEEIRMKYRAVRRLPVDAWNRELSSKITSGTLSTIDNEIDQTTGTLKLRAIFNNENRALYPNQFVNARLLEQEKTGVTLLPTAAIQRSGTDTYVYLIKPDNTVTVRDIKAGTTEGEQSEIVSGLVPGDKVVMTGVEKLQEGSKVAPTINGAL